MNASTVPHSESLQEGRQSQLTLLLADDDAAMRSRIAGEARARLGALQVLEVEDGGEAIVVGLRQRPQLALLDVSMPRLGGIEAALALRQAQPQLRLALHTDDPLRHFERARDHGLPLFDAGDLRRTIGWLERQAELAVRVRPRPRLLTFVCTRCGYGIARPTPPRRCPMCQSEGAWARRTERTAPSIGDALRPTASTRSAGAS